MSIDLGPNVKLCVHPSHRGALRRLFEEGLGATRETPSEGWDLFLMGRGGSIGAQYTEQVLSPEQARLGAWLEILVADVPATRARLAALGHTPFPFVDEAHAYYQAPGGQVFRLAAA